MSNLATKLKFALAALIGLVAGVVSAFVKWGGCRSTASAKKPHGYV